jgi:hypothetical protein
MDDATVLHGCRLLQEGLCDDLELRQLTVNVERDRVSLTIHPKRGRQEIKAVVGENSMTENVRLLDDWRTLARNGRNLKPSPPINRESCSGRSRRVGAREMSDNLYTLVGYQVEVTADWRRRQAEYFPHDDRNARAAKELERLAGEVDQLEGSSVHEQIRLATDRLKDEDWFAMRKAFTPSYAQSVLTVPTRVACDSWNGIAIGYGGDPTRCRRKLFSLRSLLAFLV